MEKRVRTRIAPSPTGDPHVGTAYIALFNLAFAKKNGGDFILRIEDTDRTRLDKESEIQIFDSLKWLGLNYSEGPDMGGNFGPYRQSERFDKYGEYAQKLIDNGAAYKCFCTKERLADLREHQKENKLDFGYDRHCRDLSKEEVQNRIDAGEEYVIRLKMPTDGETVIKDFLRGEVKFDNNKIDDQVLLKADGFPTYHLASVVDDYLMEITHVIRAEEWIISTAKHVQLYKGFGWDLPTFIHMPLLRNADKTKISKRKNPVSLNFYKEEGYLKEAMINFLGLMGYSISDDKEVFFLNEFIDTFDISKVSLGGPVFDLVKLGWLNNQHMKLKDVSELTDLAIPYIKDAGLIGDDFDKEMLKRVVEISRERSQTLKELAMNSKLFLDDNLELPVMDESLTGKEKKSAKKLYNAIESEVGLKAIKLCKGKLESANEKLSDEEAKSLLNSVIEEIGEGPGKVMMPLRVAITAQGGGADLYQVISILGKERTIKRIEFMLNKYSK